LGPEQGHQGDSLHHPALLTAPVKGHPLHLPGIGLIQGGVVQHQQPPLPIHESLGCPPQRLRVGRLPLQQAGEGVVGRRVRPFRGTAVAS